MISLAGMVGGKSARQGHPFRARLRAWWDGYELGPVAPKPAPSPPPVAAPKIREPKPLVLPSWTGSRIDFTQYLFGEGMTGPFSEELGRLMIDPLGLNEKHSVVELGTGLGGFGRWVSKHTNVYVTGFETNAELARVAQELSVMAGMAKKTRIVQEQPGAYDVRARTVDALISKESLFTYPDKATLFQSIRRSLKPGAQVSFTDYVLEGDAMAPDILVWAAHEPTPPHLITTAQYRTLLEKHDLEVSILEDITPAYTQAVKAQFAIFAESLKEAGPEDERRTQGLEEGEFWNRRLRVMELGLLRVCRFYARLPAQKA